MKHLKYKKRLLLRCIHHFKSDLIYNMDHMRIPGTEPSSVILGQTKYMYLKRLKVMPKKCRNKLKPKGIFDPQRLWRISTKCITIGNLHVKGT